MTRYLSFEDVLRQVDRVGFVVRDPGLLASAVARPEASVFGEDAYSTMWLKAAALCQSIDNNQALVDGNKRLAWLSTKVFLVINGRRLEATANEGERFMLDLVAGHAELSAIADWLQDDSTDSEAPDPRRLATMIIAEPHLTRVTSADQHLKPCDHTSCIARSSMLIVVRSARERGRSAG